MILTRLDALHPIGDGVFCQFFTAGSPDARALAECLRVSGWEVDLYDEELGPLEHGVACFLTQGFWPQVPTSQILGWFPLYLPEDVNPDLVVEPTEASR